MCIIAVKPIGKKMFPESQIAEMFARNPDGAGFMYYDMNIKKVVVHKGFLTLNSLLKALNEKDYTFTNLILHFRIGTSGKFDALNCHPFPIYEANKTEFATDIAVAHNGILYDYTPAKNSPINDTQIFIGQVLKHLKPGFQYDADKMALIGELIGNNKLAFLDRFNRVKLIGDFIEDGGYLYSNYSYKYGYGRTVRKADASKKPSAPEIHKQYALNCASIS